MSFFEDAWPNLGDARLSTAAALALVLMAGFADRASAQAGSSAPSPTSVIPGALAPASAAPDSQRFAVHAQATLITQGAFGFPAAYSGAHSLLPGGQTRETADVTLYAGLRLWRGAEAWIDPELDQGFGLADTLGLAGFPSGEAYKVGSATPYVRLQRLFVRQTIDLGGTRETVAPDQNVLGGVQTADRLVLWAGKFQVTDVFDTNAYAHDPRKDFLNWTVIDAGVFDYAADPWGYTYGLAGEWMPGSWALRLGLFDMSRFPNGESLDATFTEFQWVGEGERDFDLWGRSGKLKLTAYDSRARMGDFADALRAVAGTEQSPSVLAVLRYRGHAGVILNLQQQIADDLGLFVRAGYADGHQQAYEFTDVDRTLSGGLSLSGWRWGRPDDTVGVAGVVNDASRDLKAYLAAGGLGILIGDGALLHSGAEEIAETYYALALGRGLSLGLDYQFVAHPAYNADRGPVSILAIRLHAER